MYDYIWLYATMCDFVWLCLTMCDYAWLYMSMGDKERERENNFEKMFKVLTSKLFTFVYLCLPLINWRISAQILCLLYLCYGFILNYIIMVKTAWWLLLEILHWLPKHNLVVACLHYPFWGSFHCFYRSSWSDLYDRIGSSYLDSVTEERSDKVQDRSLNYHVSMNYHVNLD